MNNSNLNKDLRIRVSEEKRKSIERIAMAESEPGDQKSISDVIRDALDEYVDGHPDA